MKKILSKIVYFIVSNFILEYLLNLDSKRI